MFQLILEAHRTSLANLTHLDTRDTHARVSARSCPCEILDWDPEVPGTDRNK